MSHPPPPVRLLLLVLLPAIVLAALGGRAIVAEMRAEESRSRLRANEAAERLARSVNTLVAEYLPGLSVPAVVTAGDAAAWVAFLEPSFVYDDALGSADPADVAKYQPTAAAASFVGDALDAAATLGTDAAGHEAVALLLRGLANAAPSPAAAESLRLAATARDIPPGARLPPAIVQVYLDIARNALQLPESTRTRLLDDFDANTNEQMPFEAQELRHRWDAARDLARRARTFRAPVAAMLPRSGGAAVLVAGPAGAFIAGGEVPADVVRERVGSESEALAKRGGFVSVHLVGPMGTRAFGSSGDAASRDVLVESVALDSFLDGWTAEAVIAKPRGVPSSALLLGATVAVATIALAWGILLLHRAAARQSQLAAERQSFLDHVAHEVRTPSAALLALGEELAGGHVSAERRGIYEHHIVSEARRLARLVDDTLDLSRLDAGRLVFERSPTDLRIVARNGIEAAAATSRTTLVADATPVVADADPAALARVVRNLVDNAVRHSGSDEPIVVRVTKDAKHAVISVADRGVGIDPTVRARLFERFHRRAGDTHETKGVGIGLALCREIVERHGGTIAVSDSDASAARRGATFTLRFLAADPAPGTERVGAAGSGDTP